jgi:hypothetical protein
MRFLRGVRERISSRAAIVGISGLLFVGGAAILFGAAAQAFGGSAGHLQRGSVAHTVWRVRFSVSWWRLGARTCAVWRWSGA